MNKWLRRLIILLIVMIPGYYFLVLHSPSPAEENRYELDMAELRTMASASAGARPLEIRVEKVAEFRFAEAMVMAGEPWRWTPIPVYSFQLVFADRTIIVDTAMASTVGVPEFIVTGFDEEALGRMNTAMEQASQIVITHEHFDHIGGILQHPNLKALLATLRLTPAQLAHEDRMLPATLPEGVFDNYRPLEYDDMLAIAPGVVLIKAPGHTPGSQMVYVQLADGREVLLLGDVAWQHRNIEAVRERPLFITAVVRENRTQVINQFQALHQLSSAEPDVIQVPGHDGEIVGKMIDTGILKAGF